MTIAPEKKQTAGKEHAGGPSSAEDYLSSPRDSRTGTSTFLS